MARSTAPTRAKGRRRELTTFVGRRRELREVKEALSSTPVLTLTGPAGVGKTRLALRAAADLRRAFPDGVWVTNLADLRDPALVTEAVASAVGLRDTSTQWLVSTLADFIVTRRLFLILDNCEHLLDACAVLADSLLRACPDLKILATSREALGIGGETVVQVAPLPLPQKDWMSPSEDLLQYDAVRLFVERARAAWPQFQITPSNAAEVSLLCRRLDGLPLALELAAVRLRAFTVDQILEQMDRRFQLLSTGNRTASVRHQSLRAAIDWSFGLLSAQEQLLWQRLGIFAGSFDLEAAETICGGGDLTPGAVGELLASLVEKSIVRRELAGSTPRYRMLETIREYGGERLRESGEESRINKQHLYWYGDLAAKVFEQSWGPSQVEWWDRAHHELANLREALRLCLAEPGEAGRGLMMAANLAYYWLTKGSIREGLRWVDALLDVAPQPSKARAMALGVGGWLAQLQGDIPKGLERFVEGERVAADVGDETTLNLASLALGGALIWEGDLDRAEDLCERCLEFQKGSPDRRWAANALATLGAVWSQRGDHFRAFDLAGRAIDLCREAGDRFFLAKFIPGQSMEAWYMGDWDRAGPLADESLRLSRAVDDEAGMALSIEILAWIETSTGRAARAARLLGGVETLWEAIPARLYPPYVPYHDACVAAARSALGEREFDRVYLDGRGMSTERLISVALDEKELAVARADSKRASAQLTPREREVAGLVARGLSNRDIASKLVISQRTAETHVEHILIRLGFTSRAQIAAWVVEEDPAASSAPSG